MTDDRCDQPEPTAELPTYAELAEQHTTAMNDLLAAANDQTATDLEAAIADTLARHHAQPPSPTSPANPTTTAPSPSPSPPASSEQRAADPEPNPQEQIPQLLHQLGEPPPAQWQLDVARHHLDQSAADPTRPDHPRGQHDARYTWGGTNHPAADPDLTRWAQHAATAAHNLAATGQHWTQPTADRHTLEAQGEETGQTRAIGAAYKGLLSHPDSEVAWTAEQLIADVSTFGMIEIGHRHVAGRGNRMIHQAAANARRDALNRLDMLAIVLRDRVIEPSLRAVIHALAADYAGRDGHRPEWTPTP